MNTAKPFVALTFDDGPSPTYTPQILSLLSRYNARATFFVLGVEVRANPKLLKDIAAQGSEVGSHSVNHADLGTLGAEAIRRHVTLGAEAIRKVLGRAPRLFRPPYGSMPLWARTIVVAEGQTPVLWDIDTQDWARPGTRLIASRVLDHVRAGDIVLFHDGGGNRSETVAALEIILPALRERGLQPVTLDTLLASGEPIHHWVER